MPINLRAFSVYNEKLPTVNSTLYLLSRDTKRTNDRDFFIMHQNNIKGDMTQKLFYLYSLSLSFLSLTLTLNMFNKCLITRHSWT